jgi:acyl-CoA synthetase (NDP forming)
LQAVAKAHNMVVCGPNCMGFLAPAHGLAISGYPVNSAAPAGPVTFITHSGSVWEAFLQNRRGIAFNYIISSGNEMVTSLADYMQFALTDPTTRVIGLFLETIRDPQRFVTALAEAAERDIPVVALKVGRSERGAELALAHSGALAGADAAYEALFAHYGVCRVKSPDEFLDTLELFSGGRRAPTRFASALLDSGGQRAMLVDLAESAGVSFARLSPESETSLGQILEPGLIPANPLDAWGTGNGYGEIYAQCLTVLDAEPASGLTLFAVDLYPTDDHNPDSYPRLVESVLSQLTKPLAWLLHAAGSASDLQVSHLRRLGIPVLCGTENGLRAAHHLLAYSDFQRRRSLTEPELQPPGLPAEQVAMFRRRLQQARGPLERAAGKEILGAYGLPAPPEVVATSLAESLHAAATIGYPVALKTAGAEPHKSDRDGVRLGLTGADQVQAAYQEMAARLGPEVLVQAMVAGGVELLLGLVNDRQFGPMLILGSGGIFVELLADTRLLLLPTGSAAIEAALLSLGGAAHLTGARGRPPVKLESVVEAALRLAALATDLGDLIAAVDLNPLLALPDRVVVVDALIVPKTNQEGEKGYGFSTFS